MTDIDKICTRLRELETKATPGIWKLWGMQVLSDQDGTSNVETAVPVANTYMLMEGKPRTFDASFIAEMRNSLLALLDDRDRLANENQQLRDELTVVSEIAEHRMGEMRRLASLSGEWRARAEQAEAWKRDVLALLEKHNGVSS